MAGHSLPHGYAATRRPPFCPESFYTAASSPAAPYEHHHPTSSRVPPAQAPYYWQTDSATLAEQRRSSLHGDARPFRAEGRGSWVAAHDRLSNLSREGSPARAECRGTHPAAQEQPPCSREGSPARAECWGSPPPVPADSMQPVSPALQEQCVNKLLVESVTSQTELVLHV